MKYPEDKKRFDAVIAHLKTTAYELSKDCNYKSVSNFYTITAGAAKISNSVAKRIVAKYPQINLHYLQGTSPKMTVSKAEALNQAHVLMQKELLDDMYVKEFVNLKVEIMELKNLVQTLYDRNEELANERHEQYQTLLKIVKKS